MPVKTPPKVECLVIKLYTNSQLTQEEIGNAVGCCQKTIGNILKRKGISLKNRRAIENVVGDNKQEILARYESGENRRAICRDFGISKAGLKSLAENNGMDVSSILYKGVGSLSGKKWNSIKRDAKRRKLLFELDIKETYELYIKQKRQCALSGMPIRLFRSEKNKNTASLDRINSSKGYINGNVQWLHKDVNASKWSHPQRRFVEICRKVTEFSDITTEGKQ